MQIFALFSFVAMFSGLFYLFFPQLAIDSPGMWVLLAFTAVGAFTVGGGWLSSDTRRSEFRPAKLLLLLLISVSVLALFLGEVMSSGLVRSGALHDLLGAEKSQDFAKTLPPLELTNAPLVSYDMAERAAEKKLSDIPALGSQVQVGHLQKQLVDGRLYWIGFLQHRGFFTWFRRGATEGYVRVSATNPSDVELVTELNGKKLHMQYLTSAYAGDNALRYMRMHGYATAGLTDLSPEVDEAGRPYIVATIFERRVGFGGLDAVGVVLLDVQTGVMQRYSVADAPKWIDRIQPHMVVQSQLEDQLEYVHGWLNPSQTDRLSISGELDVIYASDGRAHFFAGLGSKGREGGLVGFVLIDSRTKEVVRYNVAGVTESVAQAAAEGVFPEKRYSATNALPFMVAGVPAYVMALRDGTGIARAYSVVALTDYQKVAVADTLESAVRLFQGKLNLDRTHTDATPRADEVAVKATVARISMEVRDGVSNYVMVLEGQGSKLFTADINRAEDLAVTHVGDKVAIRTLQSSSRTQPILKFSNETLQALAPAGAPADVAKAVESKGVVLPK